MQAHESASAFEEPIMSGTNWPYTRKNVTQLQLDSRNPRLGRGRVADSQRAIINYLFEHDNALQITQSIAARGFFQSEPLLAYKDGNRLVVVEGNRRLAALKAILDPSLIEDARTATQLKRLAARILDVGALKAVPLIIAPSRSATDGHVAGRHIGRAVLPWQPQDRATFILEKLEVGKSDGALEDMGFTPDEIRGAKKTRATEQLTMSVDLPDDIRQKLESPRAKVITTIRRVLDSKVGQRLLCVESDQESGYRIATSEKEFKRAFGKILTMVVKRELNSRTINKDDDFKNWVPKHFSESERPKRRSRTFAADTLGVVSPRLSPGKVTKKVSAKPQGTHKSILPRSFKAAACNNRLRAIRDELVKLDRATYSNAGAVLLRVFFELSVVNYFESTGEMNTIIAKLQAGSNNRKPQFDHPTLSELRPHIETLISSILSGPQAKLARKAIAPDPHAPFSINEMNGFIHSNDTPTPETILQFWQRIEPLMQYMNQQIDENH